MDPRDPLTLVGTVLARAHDDGVLDVETQRRLQSQLALVASEILEIPSEQPKRGREMGRRRRSGGGQVAVTRAGFGSAAVLALALGGGAPGPTDAAGHESWATAREHMVQVDLRGRGIGDERVLRQMAAVPRHLFVPEAERDLAYADTALPIGIGQTISQPYVVALMTEALALKPTDRVLEVGTGSGYQAAVLSGLVAEVHTVEILEPLARSARQRLAALGYKNVTVVHGDGYKGLPGQAPFDAIVVTAAPDEVPPPLLEQLRPGGRLVVPVGPEGRVQSLLLITKDEAGQIHRRSLGAVQFVPLTRDP